jgi:UrcA family protein
MSSSPLASILAIAAVVALAGAPAAVYAQPVGEVEVEAPALKPGEAITHQTVKFADLNINTSSGAETLLRRIRNASKFVCGPQPSHPGELRNHQDYKTCRNNAVDHAVTAVANENVSKVYQASLK